MSIKMNGLIHRDIPVGFSNEENDTALIPYLFFLVMSWFSCAAQESHDVFLSSPVNNTCAIDMEPPGKKGLLLFMISTPARESINQSKGFPQPPELPYSVPHLQFAILEKIAPRE
jgi:hypothetical protein